MISDKAVELDSPKGMFIDWSNKWMNTNIQTYKWINTGLRQNLNWKGGTCMQTYEQTIWTWRGKAHTHIYVDDTAFNPMSHGLADHQ